jgi:glycosyltransferase involved in cell wall biosynthesis
MNVLWLASWFPNRTNPSTGDFIERHARAVAPFVKQLTIISVNKDDAMPAGSVEIQKDTQANIVIYRVYYGKSKWGKLSEKFFSLKRYLELHQQVFNEMVTSIGKPDLVHVHVTKKAGMFAIRLKNRYHLPYLVSEQWTGYYKNAKPSLKDFGNLHIRINKKIFAEACTVTTVSNDLGKSINQNLIKVSYQVVPNVVDTNIFYPEYPLADNKINLIHASEMGYQKNPEAIIRALSVWKQQGGRFAMQLYGTIHIHLQKLVEELGLINDVFFHGEVPQSELARAMKVADALILYSRYETFGCVLIEANACGVPVIVSDLPVFHELVEEGVNGIFVNGNDPYQLAEKLAAFASGKYMFDKEKIASNAAALYNYNNVGRKFASIYEEILSKR